MIKPYGSDKLTPLFICDQAERKDLEKEAEQLPSLFINSSAAANAVMLGAGYFTPLKGYMSLSDAINVSDTLHTTDGLFWPVPIVNRTDHIEVIKGADRIALRDPNVEGHPVLAIQNIQSIEKAHEKQILSMCQHIFRTKNIKHPGVATFLKLAIFNRDSQIHSVQPLKFVMKLSSAIGKKLSHFKHETPCTVHMKNCVK